MSSVECSVLDGGLRVVTEPTAGTRSVAFGVWIATGSRYETDAEAGIAHFIEHLIFKGTPRLSARDIAEHFDGLGGEVNAATGRDYTVFYARVLDEHIGKAAPVLADMVSSPGFYELESERQVILEEIAMYDDDPQDKVHDLIGAAVFPDQPLGRPVIGTVDVISSVDHAAIHTYFQTNYTAPTTVVAAAGAVDHDEIVELVRTHLPHQPTSNPERPLVAASPGAPRLIAVAKPTEQYHVTYGAPGIARDDPRRHAHSVLETLLGGSMSSRLFQEIREKDGLAYSVGTYSASYSDAGQVGIYLGTRADNLVEASRRICVELDRLAQEPVETPALERAKEHLRGRLVLSQENATMRMNRIGRAYVTESEYLTLDEHLERIADVTVDSVQTLAQEYWTPERFSMAAIGPDPSLIRHAAEAMSPRLAA